MNSTAAAPSVQRYVVDATWQRFAHTVVAGSPLAVFVTTAAAQFTLDALEGSAPLTLSRGQRRLVDRLLDAGAIHPITAAGVGPSRREVTVVTPQLGGCARTDGRITVDDGSSIPLAGAQLRLPSNRGPAAARNAGRTLVTTPFVAFLDADVTDVFDNLISGIPGFPVAIAFDADSNNVTCFCSLFMTSAGRPNV